VPDDPPGIHQVRGCIRVPKPGPVDSTCIHGVGTPLAARLEGREALPYLVAGRVSIPTRRDMGWSRPRAGGALCRWGRGAVPIIQRGGPKTGVAQWWRTLKRFVNAASTSARQLRSMRGSNASRGRRSALRTSAHTSSVNGSRPRAAAGGQPLLRPVASGATRSAHYAPTPSSAVFDGRGAGGR